MSDPTTTHTVDVLSCEYIVAHGFAERYLTGDLTEPERDAYEHHYFDCDRCTDELATVRALRTELAVPGALPSGASSGSQRHWWPAWLGAAAVIVLGAGLWTWWPARDAAVTPAPGATVSATTPPATTSTPPIPITPAPTSPPAQAVSLRVLGEFDPPSYEAPVLRGSDDAARTLFQAAMTHYLAGAHDRAIEGLRAATSRDPRAPDASFYLGVSLLLTKQPQAGIRELRRTIALGDSPYLEEAHFYLAKGLLQTGDAAAASRELRAMIALGGDRQRDATLLLGRIERARKER